MRAPSTSTDGVAVLCNWQGVIENVVHDGLNLTPQLQVGQSFAKAVGADGGDGNESGAALAREFMKQLRDSGYASGWEMPVLVEGHPITLGFIGCATNDGVLIIGKSVDSGATRLVAELMRINNETVNALRAALKQAALSTRVESDRDDDLLAELSRANNEVLTAQRELAKKNAILIQTNAALEEARTALEEKQAALVEANARLDALATTDGSTGVKNRRFFEEKLSEEIGRTLRYQTPLSLLLLDVDKFKQLNDSFGHPAGDEVLRTVARILHEQARSTDLVARYGGEEFALILPNTDAEGAIIMAERLRAVIERAPWPHHPITASFGAATFSSGAHTSTALISEADQALYAAKAEGRNRAIHASALLQK